MDVNSILIWQTFNGYMFEEKTHTYYWNGTTYVNNSGKNNYWGVDLISFQYIFDRKGKIPAYGSGI